MAPTILPSSSNQEGQPLFITNDCLLKVISLSLSLCRKSPTGVGWFIVETESGAAQRIHKAVDYWAKYIVEQIKSAKMTPRPAVVSQMCVRYVPIRVTLQRRCCLCWAVEWPLK